MENDETDHRDLWCGVPNLLLIAASAIAMLAKRLRAPYTVVGSSRVDLQACKLEYSIVSPK